MGKHLFAFLLVFGCSILSSIACSHCPEPVPSSPPPTPPAPVSTGCPINALKLSACVDALGGLIHIGIGGGTAAKKCCPLLGGLADLDAALCLCIAIRAKVLNINLLLPIALKVLVNNCGKHVPSDFQCPPLPSPSPPKKSPPPSSPTPPKKSPPPSSPTPPKKSPPPPSPPPPKKSPPPPSPPPPKKSPPPPSPPPPKSPPPPSPPPPKKSPPPPSPPPPKKSPPPPSPPTAVPCPPPPPPPAPVNTGCPIDALKLSACVDLLGGLIQIGIGGGATEKCCPLLSGLADLDAALCLCTAIRAKVLNISLLLPIALEVLVNNCGKHVPSDFQCPS